MKKLKHKGAACPDYPTGWTRCRKLKIFEDLDTGYWLIGI